MNLQKTMILMAVLGLVMFSGCTRECESEKLTYPETRTVDQVDDYFGTKVADPYRWLEESNDEVRQWIDAQNEVTFGYLEGIPYREDIKQRLNELYNYPRYSSPRKVGEYYFFYKNDGLQDQSVIYRQKGLEGEPVVFLDPNTLSEDGTTDAYLSEASPDNRYITCFRSEGGSDWQEIRVMDVQTGEELEDRIRWVKFSGAGWTEEGFYYSGYPRPEEGEELTAANKNHRVYFHKLGDPQEKDRLVFEDQENPKRYNFADVTEDKHYLVLYQSEGTHGTQVYIKDLTVKDAPFNLLFEGFEHDYTVIDNLGDDLLVLTNRDAPNQKIIRLNPAGGEAEDFLAEGENVIRGADVVGGKLFVSILKDASTRVFQYSLEGKQEREIELPGLGTAYGFYGKKADDLLFYTYTSFNAPPTIYKLTIETGESELFREMEVPFEPGDFTVEQVFYESKDGTRIPMFLVYKKGLKKNGKNPVYLYAYGGFNASLTPSFNTSRIALLENGFVYAMANLRGGGEYGEAWHRAGMLEKKQNVFDDFIAAAEYLIEEKYTRSEKIAIAGGSNGGLLVGACMTQRPDLFAVALPAVGVMDMLRYHKFTVGWGWAVEYGSSDNEEQFQYLYAYSPLHNLKEGVSYPATLVTTADHDDRVVPAHSFKFIAALQEAHGGEEPVLIRIETKSGHGSSSLSKGLDITGDVFAFLFKNLGVKPTY